MNSKDIDTLILNNGRHVIPFDDPFQINHNGVEYNVEEYMACGLITVTTNGTCEEDVLDVDTLTEDTIEVIYDEVDRQLEHDQKLYERCECGW